MRRHRKRQLLAVALAVAAFVLAAYAARLHDRRYVQRVPSAVRFIDRPDGYTLQPPAGWAFDASMLPVEARWRAAAASLRVFSQPVADLDGAETYVGYSNRAVDGQWNGLRLRAQWQRGHTWFREWRRPAMPLLRPDERDYAEWDTFLPQDRVLTIMVNATPSAFPAALAQARHTWLSLKRVTTSGVNPWPTPTRAATAARHVAPPPQLIPHGTGLYWGVFEPAVHPEEPSLAAVQTRERELGHRLRVVMVYLSIGRPFPTTLIRQAWSQGRIVELTLQSWEPQSDVGRAVPYTHATSNTGAILQGRYDAYFRRFARAAAAVKLPFFFRWNNEMNGDWDPWSAFQSGKDTDLYVATWRHLHAIFARSGAKNAVWVWNPNNQDRPPFRWNAAELYYPGDAYVDWIGLTAYNLGDAQPGQTWQSFANLFAVTYTADRRLHPAKPLIITEFSSHDSPGDKAAWIEATFAALRHMTAIRYAVWWDADQGNLHYKLDQPPAALHAFAAGLAGR